MCEKNIKLLTSDVFFMLFNFLSEDIDVKTTCVISDVKYENRFTEFARLVFRACYSIISNND